jgi:hypothetical protein
MGIPIADQFFLMVLRKHYGLNCGRLTPETMPKLVPVVATGGDGLR